MSNEIQVAANPGINSYAIVRNAAGQVYYAGAFETYGSSGRDADDYDIALTDMGGGMYVGDFPGALGEGEYVVTVHERLGASPDDSDLVLGAEKIYWHGTAEFDDLVVRKAAYLRFNKSMQDLSAKTLTIYDTDGSTPLYLETETDNGDGTITVEVAAAS